MFIKRITTSTTDPKLTLVKSERHIDIILLAQNTKKKNLDDVQVRFTPSNNTPNFSSKLSDFN